MMSKLSTPDRIRRILSSFEYGHIHMEEAIYSLLDLMDYGDRLNYKSFLGGFIMGVIAALIFITIII